MSPSLAAVTHFHVRDVLSVPANIGGSAMCCRFADTLRAEIHFSEFHQFEAFFALLIAIYQDPPHWLYLTTYPMGEMKRKAETFLNRNFKALTNDDLDNINDFIDKSVYAGFIDETKADQWQTNRDNIAWLLKRMAEKYVGAEEYNAYKHGLRVLTGATYLRISPYDNPKVGIHYESKDSLRFLKLMNVDSNVTEVQETFKHFNPIESVNHLSFMQGLLETIKSVRLARIKGDSSAKINTFVNFNKEDFAKLKVYTQWSVTV